MVIKLADIRLRSFYRVPGKDLYCLAFSRYDDDGQPTGETIEYHLTTRELLGAVDRYEEFKENDVLPTM